MANYFDQFDVNAFDQFDEYESKDREAGIKAAAIRNQLTGVLDKNKPDNVFNKFDVDAISDPFFHYLKNTAAETGSTLLDLLHQLGRP